MQLPRHLNYVRSLSPGKAVFFYKTAESDFEPLQIEQNKLVGQKSGFSDAYQKPGEPRKDRGSEFPGHPTRHHPVVAQNVQTSGTQAQDHTQMGGLSGGKREKLD